MIVAENWNLMRREDGAVLVRVPSTGAFAAGLPDAVFTFRAGDPQYQFWHDEWKRREDAE
ncbi:MAG: hypothetical protein HYX69_10865 [Planctomycetia bacterium]|nr:hypothetical protein [Planctomycetia bacterium]